MKLKRRLACSLFGFLFSRRPASLKPRRLLFLCYDAIGDLLLTTPLFREIKTRDPGVVIDVMATSRNAVVLSHNPYVRKIYVSDTIGLSSFRAWADLFSVRKENYDLVVDLWDRVGFIRLLKIRLFARRQLVALRHPEVERSKGVRYEQWHVYDDVIPTEGAVHFSDRMCAVLPYFNIESYDQRYDFFLPPGCGDELPPAQGGRVYVNYRGGRDNNSLTEAQIATILENLVADGLTQLVVDVYGVSEERLTQLKARLAGRNALFVNVGLTQAACIIRSSDLVVTVDTSVSHLAQAFFKPILLLLKREGYATYHNRFQPRLVEFYEEMVEGESGYPSQAARAFAAKYLSAPRPASDEC